MVAVVVLGGREVVVNSTMLVFCDGLPVTVVIGPVVGITLVLVRVVVVGVVVEFNVASCVDSI